MRADARSRGCTNGLLLLAFAVLAALTVALYIAASRVNTHPRFCPVAQSTGTLSPQQQQEAEACMRQVSRSNAADRNRRLVLRGGAVAAGLGACACAAGTLVVGRNRDVAGPSA
jgi:hypothetical protein